MKLNLPFHSRIVDVYHGSDLLIAYILWHRLFLVRIMLTSKNGMNFKLCKEDGA